MTLLAQQKSRLHATAMSGLLALSVLSLPAFARVTNDDGASLSACELGQCPMNDKNLTDLQPVADELERTVQVNMKKHSIQVRAAKSEKIQSMSFSSLVGERGPIPKMNGAATPAPKGGGVNETTFVDEAPKK